MSEVYEMIAQGDVQGVKNTCTSYTSHTFFLLTKAISCDQVEIVKHFHSLQNAASEAARAQTLNHIVAMAISYRSYNTIRYALESGAQPIQHVGIISKHICEDELMDCVFGNADKTALIALAKYSGAYANTSVVKWLCTRGHSNLLTGDIPMFARIETPAGTENEYADLYNLYHEYNIKGKYLGVCSRRTRCKGCIKEALVDLWEMDVEQFDNGIQWLPIEMVEDTIMLVK